MSATRPAVEFSMGIMASSAVESLTAANVSSNVAQGSGTWLGRACAQAIWELEPGSPWYAMLGIAGVGSTTNTLRTGY
jgi:hypothetical protein